MHMSRVHMTYTHHTHYPKPHVYPIYKLHTTCAHLLHISFTWHMPGAQAYHIHTSCMSQRDTCVTWIYHIYKSHTPYTSQKSYMHIMYTHIMHVSYANHTQMHVTHTHTLTHTHSAIHRANILIIGSTTPCRGRTAWFSAKSCHGNLEGLGIKIPPRVLESWRACPPRQLTDVLSWPVSVGDP